MAANEIIIPGADEIQYYFRNYSYANLVSDMPLLSLGMANDLARLIYKTGSTPYKIMVDASGATNLADGFVMVTSDSGKANVSAITTTELTTLDGVTSNIQAQLNNKIESNAVDSVNGETGAVVIFDQVDNTSDANKPISIATQNSLDLKVEGGASSADGNMAGFDGVTGKIIKDLGFAIKKNTDFGLLTFTTDDGCELKLTYDDVIPFYNDTGAIIKAGTVLHLKGGALVGSQVLATFEFSDASNWEKIQGTNGQATCDVGIGATGTVGIKGQFKHIDTSHTTAGLQSWISATIPGGFTNTKPSFPDYAISIGGTAISDVDGEVLVNITGSVNDTFHDAWDGSIRESFDFRVRATGGVITGTLKNVTPSRNLTLLLSDGYYTLDTTTSDLEITLTAGTDQVVQTNYVYIPKATKVLTVSLVGFPAEEHCRVGVEDCQSASDIEAKGGARGNQNLVDHIKKESNNGHILHIADWIRRQYATIDPRGGCEVTLDATAGNGYLTMTSGKVSQLHLQTIPSIAMPASPIMIANDFTTSYVETTNLNTINSFSDGTTWSNKWGKIVVWVIANKTGEPSFMLVNIPRAGTNDSSTAILDEGQFANYSIPIEYKSKAVLLGAFAIRISGAGAITYSADYQDLRGTIPSNIAGGGGGGGGGVTSYLGLTDTPSSRIGQAGKFVKCNDAETADEYNAPIIGDILGNPNGSDAGGLGIVDLGATNMTDDLNMGGNDIDTVDNISAGLANYNWEQSATFVESGTSSLLSATSDTRILNNLYQNAGFRYKEDGIASAIQMLSNGKIQIRLAISGIAGDIAPLVTFGEWSTDGILTLPESDQTKFNAGGAKTVVTKENLGELQITLAVGETLTVTSTTATISDQYTMTTAIGATQQISMLTFAVAIKDAEPMCSTTAGVEVNATSITNGWEFENVTITYTTHIPIKALSNPSNITELDYTIS